MNFMKDGRIIILSGPSGSGKTTLYQKLLKSSVFKGKLVKSISATTRSPRKGERNGKDYLFLSKEEFLTKKKKGLFLESMKVFDNYYGTPKENVKDALKKGKNVLLCIDVQGAAFIRKKCKNALMIFVKTPTLKDLENRLQNRATENSKSLELRLKIAEKELKQASEYDHIVVNDVLARAYRELAKILREEILNSPPKKQF